MITLSSSCTAVYSGIEVLRGMVIYSCQHVCVFVTWKKSVNKSFRWANAMPSNACINIVFESGNVVVERAHSVWTLYHSQHEYIILDSQLHAAQCIGRLVYMRHDIG